MIIRANRVADNPAELPLFGNELNEKLDGPLFHWRQVHRDKAYLSEWAGV